MSDSVGEGVAVWAASLLVVVVLVVQSEFSCAAAQGVALTRGEWVGCRFVTQLVAGGKRPSLALESIRPVAEKLAILVKG